jgi:hypothetical protein
MKTTILAFIAFAVLSGAAQAQSAQADIGSTLNSSPAVIGPDAATSSLDPKAMTPRAAPTELTLPEVMSAYVQNIRNNASHYNFGALESRR